MSRSRRRLLATASLLIAAALLVPASIALASRAWIRLRAAPHVFHDARQIPPRKIGVVLGGGGFYYGPGLVNSHFQRRVEAAARLWHARGVELLLASGNDGDGDCNEVTQMRVALMLLGVPPDRILEDPNSLRTLDSVLRARNLHPGQSLTLITGDYHAYRAVLLARHHGIDAIAFAPRDPSWRDSLRGKVREAMASTKALLDLYLFKTRPSLGEGGPLESSPAPAQEDALTRGAQRP